jgi:Arm DNA-binding domain
MVGRHADGGGLYLVVDGNGAKRWVFFFRREGRLREMGSAASNLFPSLARETAADCRLILARGGDPISERKQAATAAPTFGVFADQFLEAKGPGWRNAKHRAQWAMTLTKYATPIRRLPVDVITTENVLAVLKPILVEKSETASRLRGRIEQVLDAARAAGHRRKSRSVGGPTLVSSCPSVGSSLAANMRRCPMPRSLPFLPPSVSKTPSPRWRSNLRSSLSREPANQPARGGRRLISSRSFGASQLTG